MVVCLKGFRKQFEIRTKYLLVSIANFIMRAKGHEHVNRAFRKLVRRGCHPRIEYPPLFIIEAMPAGIPFDYTNCGDVTEFLRASLR